MLMLSSTKGCLIIKIEREQDPTAGFDSPANSGDVRKEESLPQEQDNLIRKRAGSHEVVA